MVQSVGNSIIIGSANKTILQRDRSLNGGDKRPTDTPHAPLLYEDSVSISSTSESISMDTSMSLVYSRDMVARGNSSDINKTIKDYVVSLLKEQGVEVKFAVDSENEIDFTEMTPEQAQELVSEDGYFGIKKTSDRIVQFATGAWGNDTSKLDEIKDAVMKGFKEAEDAFGGTLSQISYDTLDAVMKKLDSWAGKNSE